MDLNSTKPYVIEAHFNMYKELKFALIDSSIEIDMQLYLCTP